MRTGSEGSGRLEVRARENLARERAGPSSTERLHALYEISKVLTRFVSVEETLPRVLAAVTQTVPSGGPSSASNGTRYGP